MARVLTTCPETGLSVATHAVMTVRAFARLRTGLHFYCSACGEVHAATRARAWLETAGHPAPAPRQAAADPARLGADRRDPAPAKLPRPERAS